MTLSWSSTFLSTRSSCGAWDWAQGFVPVRKALCTSWPAPSYRMTAWAGRWLRANLCAMQGWGTRPTQDLYKNLVEQAWNSIVPTQDRRITPGTERQQTNQGPVTSQVAGAAWRRWLRAPPTSALKVSGRFCVVLIVKCLIQTWSKFFSTVT